MNKSIKLLIVSWFVFTYTQAQENGFLDVPVEVQDLLSTISLFNCMALDTDALYVTHPFLMPETYTENQPTAFGALLELLSDTDITVPRDLIYKLNFEIAMQIGQVVGMVDDEIWVSVSNLLQQYFIDVSSGSYAVPIMHRSPREDAPIIPEETLTPDALETMRDWQLRTLVVTETLIPLSSLIISGSSIVLQGNPIKSCIVFKQADGFLKGTICSSTQQHVPGLIVTNDGVNSHLELLPSGNILVTGTFIMPTQPVVMLDDKLFIHTTGIKNTFVGTEAGNLVVTGSDNTGYGAFALHNITVGNANTGIGASALYNNISGNSNTAFGAYALYSNSSGNNNTAIGVDALYSNSTGSDNTAVGVEALYSMTGGNRNTAAGYRALYANQADDNTAVGAYALEDNTTGSRNTACGYKALQRNTTGSDNTAVGAFALASNTTGMDNVAFGYKALTMNTTGSLNTAFGYEVLMENTTGNNNTACGVQALQFTTAGEDNTAFGNYALQQNTIGSRNCAAGYQALMTSTNASDCIALGYAALQNNTTGSRNVALGAYALQNNTTGENNVAVGVNAGISNTTGSNNTFIGYNANCSVGDLNNAMAIGANAIVTNSNMVVLGASTVTAVIPGGDNVTSLGTISVRWKDVWADSIVVPSDERYKTNMKALSPEESLQFVEELEPLEYVLGGELQYGLSAQRVEALLKKQGITDFGGVYYSAAADRYGLQYNEFIPLLIAAVQRLIDEFQELQVLQQECVT